jgi:hypothetical protein
MQSTLDDFRRHARGWTVTSLTVLFGLQLLRVLFPSFVGYLRDARGVDALDLAPLALGIFALSFLAGLLRRAAGPRLAVWATAGGVSLFRLAEQVSRSPGLDLVLSAAGVVLFLLFIPQALAAARAKGSGGATRFGFAFLLGVAADTAVHVGARTLDLSWQPGGIPGLRAFSLLEQVPGQSFAVWTNRPKRCTINTPCRSLSTSASKSKQTTTSSPCRARE